MSSCSRKLAQTRSITSSFSGTDIFFSDNYNWVMRKEALQLDGGHGRPVEDWEESGDTALISESSASGKAKAWLKVPAIELLPRIWTLSFALFAVSREPERRIAREGAKPRRRLRFGPRQRLTGFYQRKTLSTLE